jgi:putative endonuclease
MEKGGCVYILTNKHHTTLYTGVTSNLVARITQHREQYYQNSFAARYNCRKLVFYRAFATIEEAIAEEKRIKGGSRAKKELLINAVNPLWNDLWEEVKHW